MRPFTSTISLEEARRRLDATVRPIGRTENITLADAAGRVAAADVRSAIDVPPFVRALMDGYAVVAADTVAATAASPARLRLVDKIYTGEISRMTVGSGTCAEIATGAPLPAGADAVVMVEQTAAEGDLIQIMAPSTPGANVGRRGSDLMTGDPVIHAGDVLTPSRIGALAATGCSSVVVFAKPTVTILSTGNEVAQPGQPLSPGEIYDVNRFTLSAITNLHGGAPLPHIPVGDTLAALNAALDACRDSDLIVFSGGSSVGNRDLVTDLINARGRMIFHGISVKPGKPTAFAMLNLAGREDEVPFFGMPGNPTSCLSNAYQLLIPFLRTLARLPAHTPQTLNAPLGRRVASTIGRRHFYTVRLENGVAFPAFKGSGDITSLSQADGYFEIAEDQEAIDEGTMVTVTLF